MGSGTLDKKQLKQMLTDFTMEYSGEDACPSDDDIEFLFKLCDKRGGKSKDEGDGKIEKKEMQAVVDAWGDWLLERDLVRELYNEYDASEQGSINIEELAEIFNAIRPASLVEVPPEVVEWGMKVSYLNNNGVLELLELARTLCAFEMWCNEKVTWP